MPLNNHNEEVALTREQHKEQKEQKGKPNRPERPNPERPNRRGKTRIRLIPMWLRTLIIALLIVTSMILGAMFGYGVMGKGDATDVFQKSTWMHIKDLVEKE